MVQTGQVEYRENIPIDKSAQFLLRYFVLGDRFQFICGVSAREHFYLDSVVSALVCSISGSPLATLEMIDENEAEMVMVEARENEVLFPLCRFGRFYIVKLLCCVCGIRKFKAETVPICDGKDHYKIITCLNGHKLGIRLIKRSSIVRQ